ncbi:MAG: RsmE family RNA methyltransferase [Paludibacteraceae bacterium]
MAVAPTKNIERYEWFIEKATEIGIDEITPLVCRYSERKVIKPERLEKLIVSAAKQSLKAYFPILNPACTIDDFLKRYDESQKFIAHCYEEDKATLQSLYKKTSDVIILIGPEGDFSIEEVQNSIKQGYRPISLGSCRLRTETAAVIACHTVVLLNEA